MAIDSKQQVTTTGIMNNKPAQVKAPDMSRIKMPTAKKTMPPREVAPKVEEQPNQLTLADKVQNLTDEDKILLDTVLSPSVSNVLKKLAPEMGPLIDSIGVKEENMIIPVSVVKNFATKRYGGQNETEAVTSFIADLQSSAPGMDNTMEQQSQPVPPDTQMASQPNDMVSPEMNTVDSGLLA